MIKSLKISELLAEDKLPHSLDTEGYDIGAEFLLFHEGIFEYNCNLFEQSKYLNSNRKEMMLFLIPVF